MEGGREGGREGVREGGREGRREGEREGGNGGWEGGREGGCCREGLKQRERRKKLPAVDSELERRTSRETLWVQ